MTEVRSSPEVASFLKRSEQALKKTASSPQQSDSTGGDTADFVQAIFKGWGQITMIIN